jgi:hypothetical protein
MKGRPAQSQWQIADSRFQKCEIPRSFLLLYMTPQMNADECRQYQVFMRLCFLNMRNYL